MIAQCDKIQVADYLNWIKLESFIAKHGEIDQQYCTTW